MVLQGVEDSDLGVGKQLQEEEEEGAAVVDLQHSGARVLQLSPVTPAHTIPLRAQQLWGLTLVNSFFVHKYN